MGEGDLFDSMPLDRHQVIVELNRELVVRRNVFPAWVKHNRLTSTQAVHRIACLEEAIRLLTEETT